MSHSTISHYIALYCFTNILSLYIYRDVYTYIYIIYYYLMLNYTSVFGLGCHVMCRLLVGEIPSAAGRTDQGLEGKRKNREFRELIVEVPKKRP